MVWALGILITGMVWLIKGNGSMKDSYNKGRNDFLNLIKGDSDVESK